MLLVGAKRIIVCDGELQLLKQGRRSRLLAQCGDEILLELRQAQLKVCQQGVFQGLCL